MATDLERLVAVLEARTSAFEKAMNRAAGVANRQGRAIETTFTRINRVASAQFTALGRTVGAAFAGVLSARGALRLSEAATRIDNALKVAGLSGEKLEAVYERLFVSAQRNAAPLESLVELYGKVALVQNELGLSTEELLGFTDKVAMALRVSGKSAAESSGALLQLSQALGSGTVRAEEFNSILEGALPIAQAAAAGLKEAGGSVAELRQLVVDGEVSSQAFFRAFEAGSVILEQKVAGSTFTVAQANENLWTALINVAREFNASTGASKNFAESIDALARIIGSFDVSGFIEEIGRAGSALDRFADKVGNLDIFERLAEFLTGKEITVGQPIDLNTVEAEKDLTTLERQVDILRQRIEANKEMAIDTSEAEAELNRLLQQANAVRAEIAGAGSISGQNYVPGTPGDPNALAQKTGGLAPPQVKPVSLADYSVPSSSKGGGGGAGSKSKASDYQREVEQIRARTEAIIAETQAQAGLNPLIDDYGFAVAKARAEQELINAAKKDGKTITPELAAEIDNLATAYARAEVEAKKLEERQDGIREAADFMADTLGDSIMSMVPAIKTGNEELDQLLNTLMKTVLQAMLLGKGPLAGLFGGGGGLLSWLFPGFDEGGYTGHGGRNQVAGTVHRGEYVFSKQATQKIGVGNLEAMHRAAKGYASGGYVTPAQTTAMPAPRGTSAVSTTISMPVTISAPGADPAQLARVERAVQKLGQSIPGQVDARIRSKQLRGVRP